MAKRKRRKKNEPQVAPPGMTLVNSKRYGPHLRSKRGTIKPALLNDSMKTSSTRLLSANTSAKIIFDAIRYDLSDGGLWTRLLSLFRAQIKAGLTPDVACLVGLECHEKFTVERLLSKNSYEVTATAEGGVLRAGIVMQWYPTWRRETHIDGYQVSLNAVYPDMSDGSVQQASVHGAIHSLEGIPAPLFFELPIPEGATRYLLFMIITACEKGKVCLYNNSRAKRAVHAGTIPSIPPVQQ